MNDEAGRQTRRAFASFTTAGDSSEGGGPMALPAAIRNRADRQTRMTGLPTLDQARRVPWLDERVPLGLRLTERDRLLRAAVYKAFDARDGDQTVFRAEIENVIHVHALGPLVEHRETIEWADSVLEAQRARRGLALEILRESYVKAGAA